MDLKQRIDTLSQEWTSTLINELVLHGVHTFYLAPGSRSSLLTTAAVQHPHTDTSVHFDERGLAFQALGYAKASCKPVALIVTSGTAVANLLPAIMEAAHDNVPLIVLTADRPPELRDTGANQTSDQVKIFQSFMRWQSDLPCPDHRIPKGFLGTTVAQAVGHATGMLPGPVHLNCMLRKPFTPQHPSTIDHTPQFPQTRLINGDILLSNDTYSVLAHELSQYTKGVILVGGTLSKRFAEPLNALAQKLQWPLFADFLSNTRSQDQQQMIAHYELILPHILHRSEWTPDVVLQIGERFVSQQLIDWIHSDHTNIHYHVSSHAQRKDPSHSITHRITCTLSPFLKMLSSYLPQAAPSIWLAMWRTYDEVTAQTLTSFFEKKHRLSEALLLRYLGTTLPPNTSLFVANSMPVRNGDAFFCPPQPIYSIHCNRGLSGIDGNIATSAGIAQACNTPVIAIIGDIAFLHDLNSLALISHLPVHIIVINNGGGSIFSQLPISKHPHLVSPYFTTPHNFNMEHAASLFQLSYTRSETIQEVEDAINKGTTIIEVPSFLDQNKEVYQALHTHLTKALEMTSLETSC